MNQQTLNYIFAQAPGVLITYMIVVALGFAWIIRAILSPFNRERIAYNPQGYSVVVLAEPNEMHLKMHPDARRLGFVLSTGHKSAGDAANEVQVNVGYGEKSILIIMGDVEAQAYVDGLSDAIR